MKLSLDLICKSSSLQRRKGETAADYTLRISYANLGDLKLSNIVRQSFNFPYLVIFNSDQTAIDHCRNLTSMN